MAFNINEIKIVVESFETTPYEYEWAPPCEKVSIKDLSSRLLPPLYSLVFIIGLLGNMMVVLILIKYRRLRIMTNIYLLNLTISDLLFLFTVPLWIHYVLWNEWSFGRYMCKMLSGFYYLALYSEIFFIILLTIDRYLAIVYAVFALRARTVTFAIITSIITWGLASLAALPEFIFHESQHNVGDRSCIPHYPEGEEDSWKRFHALRMNIFGLALPLLIMVICYSGIIKTLLRCPNKKKQKAIRLIFVVMIVFFIFWTPYNLVLLFTAFQSTFLETSCQQSKHLDLAMQVTEAITHIHCCINPIIYAFVGERFRKYLRLFFHRNVAIYLGKSERTSSVSPSTGEQEISLVV